MKPGDEQDHRSLLIDQLAFLVEEIDTLEVSLDSIPAGVLEAVPPDGGPSIKEMYAILAVSDRDLLQPALRAETGQGGVPEGQPVDTVRAERWNDRPIQDILDEVRAQRREAVRLLESFPPDRWRLPAGQASDVFVLAYEAAQRDVEWLRRIAMRLYESRWPGRAPE